MRYVLIFAVALGAILLFLLAASTANTPVFSRHYSLLLGLNGALALAMLVMVVWQLWGLAKRRRGKVFGSLLNFRLLLTFSVFALVPGVLVYTVSVQFLAKSVESWFDVRVDRALEGGLNLGRAALDTMLQDLVVRAGAAALAIGDVPQQLQPQVLPRLREQIGVEEATLIAPSGRVLAADGRDGRKVAPPGAAILARARTNPTGYGAVEPEGEKGLLMRAVVQVRAASGELVRPEEMRLLQITQRVPTALAEAGESVQSVYHAYRELSLSRQGLKEIYILTLTLTLLLALFAAMGTAFLLSRRLSEPLAVLAQGTEAVARGDLSARVPVTSNDEFGTLTRSFNTMTSQLDEAHAAAERNRGQLETAKAYLENVLANLSAGVLVFDGNLALTVANRGAEGILSEPMGALRGSALTEWNVQTEFAQALAEELRSHGETAWQRQVELASRGTTLLLRGSALPSAAGGGYVVVFDDVTQLIAAQRATAWGEVARRLAHEIKNPLTPIQLSAERLAAKLGDKLSPEDAAVLARGTDTIVTQVGALKNMVDEFREYARTPAPVLDAVDLNALIREVLALYENSPLAIVPLLAEGLPAVHADRNQLRQVIHNLLTNAQDAMAGSARPEVGIATTREGGRAWLRITDNGSGFPDTIIKRAFEPYVTTKPRGTGLGLAIVKKIIDEHRGQISIDNRIEDGAVRGARISIALPLAAEAGASAARPAGTA